MCPPPSEPIRPIGPLAGDVYVERARFAERVERRRPRGEQDEREHPGGRQPEEDAEDDGTERWFAGHSPLDVAGGYDDHGRRRAAAAATERDSEEQHVDRRA